MKNKILILLLTFTVSFCFSQQKVTWDDLAKVKFTEKYFPAYESDFLYPEFSSSVKALEGKRISVAGYFLSIDPDKQVYILSKGPMASCFFCGVGGPETAIELQFDSKQKYTTDTVLVVTGTLKLNADDVEHFNYILTDCTATTILN